MENENEQNDNARNNAVLWANIVYYAAVVFSVVIFINFVLNAFPEDAYFLRGVMVLAGGAVGCSALAFPYALHNWAIDGSHKKWAKIFYYGEIGIIGLNIVVGFASLLQKHAGWVVPEWIVWFEPLSVLQVVYTILAWGTLFQLDPISESKAQRQRNKIAFENAIEKKVQEKIKAGDFDAEIENHALARLDKLTTETHRKHRTNVNTYQAAASVDKVNFTNPPTHQS